MHPAKVDRAQLRRLTDLPNVGPACVQDLHLLGIHEPAQLRGCDAFEMHAQLCQRSGVRHDPCVIDVFLSIVRFMQGEAPRHWWEFSAERKTILASRSALTAEQPPSGDPALRT
ncbi:helix-hairpin-helix domain-containing protein [Xanthomonas cassavae CFBP 4642]|uniref:Helix-hairpin-helix domain-containing protein n=1 Tax=Xanthomonas cassavae CFBP 4642 TaxID=1219375 RepID=A0ABS8HHE9_9XANT|nr:helix-hairpin-helix domain-containing protein [Xanthomonas cassavae]MCC4621598.1 helix-hairpin-helix domain-containing protein [Xanthomonas cassavae CFBP 4642]